MISIEYNTKGFINYSLLIGFSVIVGLVLMGGMLFLNFKLRVKDSSKVIARESSLPNTPLETFLPITSPEPPMSSPLLTTVISSPRSTPSPKATVLPVPTLMPVVKKKVQTPTPLPSPSPEIQDAPKMLSNYISPRPIDLQSIVGIQCNFSNQESEPVTWRGSGVFINSEGYILTNRHLVDPKWTKWAYSDNEVDETMRLLDCEVRFLNSEKILTVEEYQGSGIRLDATPYGFLDLGKTSGGPYYDFKAEVVYVPDEQELSETERRNLDFAVLRITTKNPNKYSGSQNPKIHFSPILLPTVTHWETVLKNKKILIPGYAYQEAGANSFQDYRLLTKEGEIMKIYVGDTLFTDTPFVVETKIYPDSSGGRSGSPIFYNGYVVGLYQNKGLPQENDPGAYLRGYQTSINAVLRNLVKTVNEFSDIFDDINYFEIQ